MDDALFSFLNQTTANRLFDAVFPTLTNLHKQPWFLVPAALLLLWSGRKHGKAVLVVALTMAIAAGLSDVTTVRIMKRAFDRPRPCQEVSSGRLAVPTVRVLTGEHCPGSRSFPSSHAANTAAVASVALVLLRNRKRWWWLALPLVIGYTRIYLGYHYPTDVLGGWIAGGLVGLAIGFVGRRWLPQPIQPEDEVVYSTTS